MIEFTGYPSGERAKYAIKIWKIVLVAIMIFSFALLYIPVVYLIVAIDVIHVLWFLPGMVVILIIVFYRVPPSKYHALLPYKTVIEDDIVYIEGEEYGYCSRELRDVKTVIDYGTWYRIIFYSRSIFACLQGQKCDDDKFGVIPRPLGRNGAR